MFFYNYYIIIKYLFVCLGQASDITILNRIFGGLKISTSFNTKLPKWFNHFCPAKGP